MSVNPAIPCCCGGKPSFVCCKTFTMTLTCEKEATDAANCTTVPDGSETVEFTYKQASCVASEEECVCREGETPIGGPGFSVTACTAEFTGVECENNQVPADFQGCKSEEDPPCCKFDCGPCGRKKAGISAAPCPPPPPCEDEECCEPPPPVLCCCVEYFEDCVSKSCQSCSQPIPSNCFTVTTCDQCTNPDSVLIVSPCCSSLVCEACGGPGAADGHKCYDLCGPGGVCCWDCVTYDASGPTCTTAKCLLPCPDTIPNQLPLCNCGPVVVSSPCISGLVGSGGLNETSAGTGPDNKLGTLIENSLEKGLIRTETGVNLNTLFLFGYGYNNL